MDIRTISAIRPDPVTIDLASKVLRRGGIIVYPSDTCYGLGADARNERAMAKIEEMKQGRSPRKRFSVIARDVEHIREITFVGEEQHAILSHCLPGPYTFILLNLDFRVAQTNTLGVRVPSFPVTQAIADVFEEPYLTTSANFAGEGALYTSLDLREKLIDRLPEHLYPDLVLDAGDLPERPSSTVVDITKLPPKILRQGLGEFSWPLAPHE